MFRQGDVLVVPVKSIPDGLIAVPRENGDIVLAHGEVTGHRHRIPSPGVDLFARALRDDGVRYLVVEDEPATLLHEEHSTILLPAGRYEVRRQREYTPQEVRRVAD